MQNVQCSNHPKLLQGTLITDTKNLITWLTTDQSFCLLLSIFPPCCHVWRCSPLAVLSLQVYVPLSSSCTELSSNLHLFPSKCILQFKSAGWMSFPSDSQSTSTSCGPITWHSNSTDSPAFTITSLRGRTMARPGSTGVAGRWIDRV